MITDTLENYRRYSNLHEDWDKAFALVDEMLLKPLPTATNTETTVDGIKVVVQNYATLEPGDKKFEGHKKCVDIQFLVKGRETIHYADGKMMDVATPYNGDRDHMQFVDHESASPIHLQEKRFAVFFPMEAHKTQCKWGPVTDAVKIIVKLPL